MKFKNGVDPRDLSAPAWYGLWICEEVYQSIKGLPLWCTSTGEGKHTVEYSKHYAGAYGRGFSNAFDIRTWYLHGAQLTEFIVTAREQLGRDYVVVKEPDHIHVHWSPTYHG